MVLSNIIFKLRTNAGMSREKFAEVFEVSHQAVQKWETGVSVPELGKIVRIAKYFDISIDAMILGSDARIMDEMAYHKIIKPNYEHRHAWELYYEDLLVEYEQSTDEGLDIERYKELFEAVSNLPRGEIKKKFGDILFEVVMSSSTVDKFKYIEPSDFENIKIQRKPYSYTTKELSPETLKSKIYGAWFGRIAGCLLGKPVEGARTIELVPFLQDTGNYPMYRYIHENDVKPEICNKYNFRFNKSCIEGRVDYMPADDDTNYMVLYQLLIEKYGRDFTSQNVAQLWLDLQPKDAYCTAERVAFCNFVKGYEPPESALYKNPYREWIGAQIRGDYFGYINPGDPETAADMAYRDACVSHVKNGIYGEMFVSAMIAVAAVCDDIVDIIEGGLAQIPHGSRLYESVRLILDGYKNGVSQQKAFEKIHEMYNEYSPYGWCHTIPNAMIVAAALLYGEGDFGKSICMAVETGFDTDCNGATVGSVLGIRGGIECIGEEWTKPLNNKLETMIFGVGMCSISDRADITLKHIK